jgi:hypothetical protein
MIKVQTIDVDTVDCSVEIDVTEYVSWDEFIKELKGRLSDDNYTDDLEDWYDVNGKTFDELNWEKDNLKIESDEGFSIYKVI